MNALESILDLVKETVHRFFYCNIIKYEELSTKYQYDLTKCPKCIEKYYEILEKCPEHDENVITELKV